MYRIYWTTYEPDGTSSPQSEDHGSDQLTTVLKRMEELRKLERDGAGVGFVGMVSQNPNSVGHPGVDVTGPDYDWYKRRLPTPKKQ